MSNYDRAAAQAEWAAGELIRLAAENERLRSDLAATVETLAQFEDEEDGEVERLRRIEAAALRVWRTCPRTSEAMKGLGRELGEVSE